MTDPAIDPLFEPLRVGALRLPNRIVMAPMTRNRAAPGGVQGELHARYYAQRASAGLIVTEGTYPDPSGRGYVRQPGIADDAQARGWRLVTDAVHGAGGRIFVQLHHVGRISHPSLLPHGRLPVAPSAVRPAGEVHIEDGGKDVYPTPRALERHELSGIVDQFRRAAERSLAAGFDGYELHAANGYLPHTFLSSRTNLRGDDYGGSVENRARFVVELAAALAAVDGPGRVGVKVSPGHFLPHDIVEDDAPELYAHLARELERLGVGYLHVQRPITDWGDPGLPFDPLALVRPHYSGPLIAGGALDARGGAALLRDGRADAIAFGRAFLANPDLPARLRRGAPLAAPDEATFYSEGPRGYTDYPSLEGAAIQQART